MFTQPKARLSEQVTDSIPTYVTPDSSNGTSKLLSLALRSRETALAPSLLPQW